MKWVFAYKCKQKIRVLYVIDRTNEEIARGKEEEEDDDDVDDDDDDDEATIKLHKEKGA